MKILQVTSADVKLMEIEKAKEEFEQVFSLDVEIGEENDEEDGTDPKRGFIGTALIYDQEVFINTFTGEGYDVIAAKMKNYINWYSGKIRLAGFDRDDIKQLIATILFDGVRRYNPSLKIKLSTFLYVHIKNRIISRIKKETRQSLNATYNDPNFKIICGCGVSFVATKQEAFQMQCVGCNKKIDNACIMLAEHCEPISLDCILSISSDDHNDSYPNKTINIYNNKSGIIEFFGRSDTIDEIDKNLDLKSILCDEDELTCKIAELMYYKDYSITDAAKEVGLTSWAASLRLKKLNTKKRIREHFINR